MNVLHDSIIVHLRHNNPSCVSAECLEWDDDARRGVVVRHARAVLGVVVLQCRLDVARPRTGPAGQPAHTDTQETVVHGVTEMLQVRVTLELVLHDPSFTI